MLFYHWQSINFLRECIKYEINETSYLNTNLKKVEINCLWSVKFGTLGFIPQWSGILILTSDARQHGSSFEEWSIIITACFITLKYPFVTSWVRFYCLRLCQLFSLPSVLWFVTWMSSSDHLLCPTFRTSVLFSKCILIT